VKCEVADLFFARDLQAHLHHSALHHHHREAAREFFKNYRMNLKEFDDFLILFRAPPPPIPCPPQQSCPVCKFDDEYGQLS
jgi:hypothetical protein